MFRSDWDLVAPSTWLSGFADEEAFFGGPSSAATPATTTMYIVLPESEPETQRGRRGRGRGGRRARRQQKQRGATESERAEPKEEEGQGEEGEDEEEEDEDFFANLPFGARQLDTQVPANLAPPLQNKTKDGYSYLTYAYSTCATLDDNGQVVESTRRRYEDSAGVLKAVHRRLLGDRTMQSTWLKRSADDEGKHEKNESSGDVAGFEQAWMDTPFGQAERRAVQHGEKKQTELPDAPPPQEIP